jgi:hypothetical protein
VRTQSESYELRRASGHSSSFRYFFTFFFTPSSPFLSLSLSLSFRPPPSPLLFHRLPLSFFSSSQPPILTALFLDVLGTPLNELYVRPSWTVALGLPQTGLFYAVKARRLPYESEVVLVDLGLSLGGLGRLRERLGSFAAGSGCVDGGESWGGGDGWDNWMDESPFGDRFITGLSVPV